MTKITVALNGRRLFESPIDTFDPATALTQAEAALRAVPDLAGVDLTRAGEGLIKVLAKANLEEDPALAPQDRLLLMHFLLNRETDAPSKPGRWVDYAAVWGLDFLIRCDAEGTGVSVVLRRATPE